MCARKVTETSLVWCVSVCVHASFSTSHLSAVRRCMLVSSYIMTNGSVGKFLPPPQHMYLRKMGNKRMLLRSEASSWWRKGQNRGRRAFWRPGEKRGPEKSTSAHTIPLESLGGTHNLKRELVGWYIPRGQPYEYSFFQVWQKPFCPSVPRNHGTISL